MSPFLMSPSPTSPNEDFSSAKRATKKPRLPSSLPSSSGAPAPTGHRRNITAANLVPLDAPTQPRAYITTSSTSRKDIPAAFTHRAFSLAQKRSAEAAALDSPSSGDFSVPRTPVTPATPLTPLITGSPLVDDGLMNAIEAKRRQNTLAARRSRQRKLEHVRHLEQLLEMMTRERDQWMERALRAEKELGITDQ